MQLWRAHLPPPAGEPLRIHCVELHAEVIALARSHFDFGRHEEAGAAVTVEVADGRAVLARSPAAAFDLVVVDLSVAGFVDAAAAADLRRVLRPGGVCVHNYNYSAGLSAASAVGVDVKVIKC